MGVVDLTQFPCRSCGAPGLGPVCRMCAAPRCTSCGRPVPKASADELCNPCCDRQAYVAALVDAAPPLSPAQRDQIRDLCIPGLGGQEG